jgi:hypothetical protein
MDRREVIARELAGNVNTWRRANKTVRGSLLGKADRILVALGEQAGTADLLQRIVDEHPCEGDYEADARYVWPSRWEALRSALIANLPAALKTHRALYMVKLMKAASHALRSYEIGNSDPTIAKTVADQIDAALAEPREGGKT